MIESRKTAALAVLALILAAGTATACNTVRGAGQDVQAGGRVVEDAAEDVQEEIDN